MIIPGETSMQAIQRIAQEKQCGLIQAKNILLNYLLLEGIDKAQSIDDLKLILKQIVERKLS